MQPVPAQHLRDLREALQTRLPPAARAATVASRDGPRPRALHDLFGFGDFRPGQREACEAALAGRDVLVVMPTGSGKSLCYQLPGLLRDDLTVVVSPLVALMQDQVEALAARGLGDRVALVNAQQDGSANAGVLERAAAGELRLLYVAPERFAAPGFLERMRDVRVGLFVVDEAHCVSQWGHDFRPDYFRLADAARMLGAQALVASTATATARVARDVEQRLALRDPLRVATGFDRPNIAFAVARPGGAREAAADRRGAAPSPTRCPRSSTRARARAPRSWPRELTDRARRGGGRLPRRARPRARAPPFSAASWRTRCAVIVRHQRLRDGRRQAQRAHGRARQRAGVARGVLPGGRPRRPRRRAGARAAAGREPRQGAARPLHQARARSTTDLPGWLADRIAAARRRRRPLRRRRARARARPRAATATGCARCSGISPARA